MPSGCMQYIYWVVGYCTACTVPRVPACAVPHALYRMQVPIMLKSDFCTLSDYTTDKELTDVGECPMDSVRAWKGAWPAAWLTAYMHGRGTVVARRALAHMCLHICAGCSCVSEEGWPRAGQRLPLVWLATRCFVRTLLRTTA